MLTLSMTFSAHIIIISSKLNREECDVSVTQAHFVI